MYETFGIKGERIGIVLMVECGASKDEGREDVLEWWIWYSAWHDGGGGKGCIGGRGSGGGRREQSDNMADGRMKRQETQQSSPTDTTRSPALLLCQRRRNSSTLDRPCVSARVGPTVGAKLVRDLYVALFSIAARVYSMISVGESGMR